MTKSSLYKLKTLRNAYGISCINKCPDNTIGHNFNEAKYVNTKFIKFTYDQ